MPRVGDLIKAAGVFGLRDGSRRLAYEFERGSGLLDRRMSAHEASGAWKLSRIAPNVAAENILSARRRGEVPFFFPNAHAVGARLEAILGADGRTGVIADAERVLEGKIPFFGRLWFECGSPPNWFRNPATGQSVDHRRRWTTMRFADAVYGDLRFILEPSRFLFVYPLARAFALTGEERFAEGFWCLFEDWCARNPSVHGPLWICGQECSLRILAWSFAFYALIGSAATTQERAALLVSAIAAHAWRVEQTIGYARSQRSNHLFSEAVGLWTAGVLYPELSSAARWGAFGSKLLREAVLDQITRDGAHLQFSFNYQRMVLQLLFWTLRLAEVQQVPLPPEINQRTAAAFDVLSMFVDCESGCVPNYGSNDGTLILPLARTDYRDFRPLLRMGATVLGRKGTRSNGPWDEVAVWLGEKGGTLEGIPAIENRRGLSRSGYYRLGDNTSWAMVRAGYYTRRPFQSDQLHVDLWWQGLNIALDPGTYLYNGDSPWDNGLASTAVHNTVMIDDREQMRRAGRFLWLDWAQGSGKLRSLHSEDLPDCFEGEHNGYRSIGVGHCRTVTRVADGAWLIADDLFGKGEHDARLHWLVPDMPFEMGSHAPLRVIFQSQRGSLRWSVFSNLAGAASIVRAGKGWGHTEHDKFEKTMGWQSPTYGELIPAVSLTYRVRGLLPIRLITVMLAGDELQTELTEDMVRIWHSNVRIHEVSLIAGKV